MGLVCLQKLRNSFLAGLGEMVKMFFFNESLFVYFYYG